VYVCVCMCVCVYRHTSCARFSQYIYIHTHTYIIKKHTYIHTYILCRVVAGVRPERPQNCPDAIFKLMEQCWQHTPADRPTFANLKMGVQDAYANEIATHAAHDQSLCVVCLDKQADFALFPCGHKCMCEEDAVAMCRMGMCPLCRTPVQSYNKIFCAGLLD